jgi:exosortase K
MTPKLAVVAATVLIAWGLKRHYADARADDLAWVLAPTARLAGMLTDTAFTMQPGEGYLSRERLFAIEKSCAGVNFIVAAFGMLTLARLHRAASPANAVRLVAAALVVAYTTGVVVNAVRISIAIWLARHQFGALSAGDVHRIEGVVVYFGGLLLLYEVMTWLDTRLHLRPTTP